MVRVSVAILTRGPLSTIFIFALYCAQRHYLRLSLHSFYHSYRLATDFLWIRVICLSTYIYRLQLKCVPLQVLSRTKPGVNLKSTQFR